MLERASANFNKRIEKNLLSIMSSPFRCHMWMNALQALVDVIKNAKINLVHISAAVIRDTPQMGKDAEVHLPYPLPKSM